MHFDVMKEFWKWAGLELAEGSTDKHNGRIKINKRGRKSLGYLLPEFTIPIMGKNEGFKKHNL